MPKKLQLLVPLVGPEGPQGPRGETGFTGKDGVTFTPSVTEDGTVSWSNNGGLNNPTPVTIKNSGIHIGTEEPINPNANIWIDPDDVTDAPEDNDCIPIPETATVGQTIVVKAVDENGKPTEWEAADFPSGGSGNGIRLVTELDSDVTSVSFDDLDNKKVILHINGCVNNADRTLADGATTLILTINDINYAAAIPMYIRNNLPYPTLVFIECVHDYCIVKYAHYGNAGWNQKVNMAVNFPNYTSNTTVKSIKKLTISVNDKTHVIVANSSIKVVAE